MILRKTHKKEHIKINIKHPIKKAGTIINFNIRNIKRQIIKLPRYLPLAVFQSIYMRGRALERQTFISQSTSSKRNL